MSSIAELAMAGDVAGLSQKSALGLMWHNWKAGLASKAAGPGRATASLLPKATGGMFGESVRFDDRAAFASYDGWVFAAVDAKAKRVAEIERQFWRVDREGEKTQLFGQPFQEAIEQPNDLMDGYTLWALTSTWLDLNGRAYWWKIPGPLRTTIGYFPLRPDLVRPVVNRQAGLAGFRYFVDGHVGGKSAFFERAQVIQFLEPNPVSLVLGYPQVAGAAHDINTDRKRRITEDHFFENMARPDYVVRTPHEDRKAIRDLLAQLLTQHQGMRNFGLPLAIPKSHEIHEFKAGPVDSGLYEGRDKSRDAILAVLKTSKVILGLTENVTRANVDAAEVIWAKTAVRPRLTLMHNAITCQHIAKDIPTAPGITLKSWFKDPVPADRAEARADLETQWKLSAIKPDEVRQHFGREEEGGAAAELYIDASKFPLGSSPIGPPVTSGDESRSAPRSAERSATKGLDLSDEAVRAELWKRQSRVMLSAERVMARFVNRAFRKQGERIVPLLAEQVGQLESRFAGWSANKVRRKTQAWLKVDEFEALVNRIWDAVVESREMATDLRPGIEAVFEIGGKQVEDLLGLDFDVRTPLAQEWIAARTLELTGQVNETTQKRLAQRIASGIEEGLSLADITDSIADIFDVTGTEGGKARAVLVARTETTAAFTRGKTTAVLNEPVLAAVMDKMWLSARDDRVREAHNQTEGIDGERVPVVDEGGNEGVFSNGLLSPGVPDPEGGAVDVAQIANCRCDVIFTRKSQ